MSDVTKIADRYVITLTEEEAIVVMDVMGWVGGEGPEREVTDKLFYSLSEVGVPENADRPFFVYDYRSPMGIRVIPPHERKNGY